MQLSSLLGQIVDTPEPTGLPTTHTEPLSYVCQTNSEQPSRRHLHPDRTPHASLYRCFKARYLLR